MDETDHLVLAPLGARWFTGLGVSDCCNVVVEVLTAPDGSVIVSRCGFCHAGFFDAERAAS